MADDDLIETTFPTGAATSEGRPPAQALSALSHGHRFAPGAIIAGRYRVVALLGRGGMGEVYRAEDLTLDQPVALKFLPGVVAAGDARLAQFHNELKTARQVSHKNVCRLYDLGEADGRRFLTMEYVDGEDLSSLLHRIGRKPHDKAVEIARQLCAGLAAAHDRGVVHRDLKPSNVMIDAEGNVRVTDFGIATAVGAADGGNAGTPQYMAPEQFAGRPASIKSDIYALGLILFEVFTGRRAVDARTLADLQDFHERGTVTTPSSIVRDVDPAVERLILRCLERDPERRPMSALVVAAGLPGADPLAAALAAGETPSPDLLAAAAESGAISNRLGLSLTLLTIAGLLVFAVLSSRTSIVGRVPLDLPPAVLVDRAEHVLEVFGYPRASGDAAFGFVRSTEYTRWLANGTATPQRYDPVAIGRPSPVLFWYRGSPRALVAVTNPFVSTTDPPSVLTDMRTVVLDGKGRLQEFRSVPAQLDESDTGTGEASWQPAFAAAGLEMTKFTDTAPGWIPRDFADQRTAWEGALPETGAPVRVEAASYRGRPTYFAIVGPWTRPVLQQPARGSNIVDRAIAGVAGMVALILLAIAATLAKRNAASGRADRRGATRLAIFMAATGGLAWVVKAHHTMSIADEFTGLSRTAADFAFYSGILWVNYVALEPYIRRLWPDTLLRWSRLLAGHLRDPRVGRDVLTGLCTGTALALLQVARTMVIPALGYATPSPPYGNEVDVLAGTGDLVGRWLLYALRALGFSSVFVLVVVLIRFAFRSERLATPLTVLLFALLFANEAGTTNTSLIYLFPIAGGAMLTWVLTQHGLLSLVLAWFTLTMLTSIPMVRDTSHWSAAAGNWTVAALAALTLFAWYAARAGQPLFERRLHGER